jgi:signal transduction histidine kinase
MSLRRKIIGWFVVFAALTVIVFGLGDYIQSTRALRFALETRSGSLAMQVASDAERRYQRAESELLALGYAVAAGALEPAPALRGGYTDVRVLRDGAPILEADFMGVAQPESPGCGHEDVLFDIAFQVGAGQPHRVVARTPAEHLFAGIAGANAKLGRRGVAALVRSSDGALVFDAGCRIAADAESGALTESIAHCVASLEDAGPSTVVTDDIHHAGSADRTLAMVRTSRPSRWTAIASLDYAEFAAPFAKMRRQYFGVIGLVLLIPLALVLLAIRRDMRRLAAISAAADAIGHGRFDVWLPPPTGDEIGRVSLALGRMTERLSSSLRQIEVSRSMAAVGELATYLSHEVRNPLSSMRLNLQMLGRDLRAGTVPDDGQQLVGLCLSELQRLDDVVRTVLEVGRAPRQAGGACPAHQVIEETLRVMQRKVQARGIWVDTSLEARRADVAMDSASLRGVVMNLVLNSMEALADRPSPCIRVRTRLLTEKGLDPRFELRVSDNGPGVPPDLRERIYDPFFTTKASGNGIGLPTALRSVQECGGTMWCQPPEWGVGAEFIVELPLAGSTVAGAAAAAAAVQPEPSIFVAAGGP